MGFRGGDERPVIARPRFRFWITVAFFAFVIFAYFVGNHGPQLHQVPNSTVPDWSCVKYGNSSVVKVESDGNGTYQVTCSNGHVFAKNHTGW